MVGIFYFSSTGNSLFAAKRIAAAFNSKIFYIPKYDGDPSEFEKIIIASPIYSFGLPVDTYDFIERLPKNIKVYIVLTYGGMIGGADYFTYTLAEKNNINIRGVYTVKMPENYTLTFSTPKFYSNMALKAAPKAIDKIIAGIKADEKNIPKPKKGKEKSYCTNKANWHLIAKDFSTNENCVLCGKCIDICPAKNITLESGKITFLDSCTACLGCYHRCPQKAIVYKNRKKKDRYLNPNICESELGKDM